MSSYRFHFDTNSEWIESVRAWASSDPRIDRVWIFGSRATGLRTSKANSPSVPDLDIGYVLTGDDDGERLGYAICKAEQWRFRLAESVPVPVDLQFAEPDHDHRVWPAILDHGVLIYPQP